MKFFRIILSALLAFFAHSAHSTPPVHVWELQELRFVAQNNYANAYTDATVWIDLKGPGFNKRVYGFWDGGDTFKVRLVAMQPGKYSWTSGSQPADAGLNGKKGDFTATTWSEAELAANTLRRGFLRASPNGHALIHADGTPFFAVGDTWFSMGASRFRWYDDEQPRPMGPNAGFKDYVRLRKAQGYNWINVIAAYPNWKTDDSSYHLRMYDSARTTVRSAWVEFGKNSAKNMDNEGGRPFLFPGRVPGYENYFPDMDRINPAYFHFLDRKIAYLNEHGFVPFLEASRRDASLLWYQYYGWPHSYARYLQYFYARYGAYNTVLSPVHLDIISATVSPADYVTAIKYVEKTYGPLPFENLLSANANPSTLENWGEDSWVTLHQIGNRREHTYYWYLTEIFYQKHPKPALNGEPYYAGYKDARGAGIGVNYTRGADGGTEKDNAYVRSCAYGSFLSGGLAGHCYGAEGIWGGDVEPEAPTKMWEAFKWRSGAEMRHLKTFALSIGRRYQDLEPNADLVTPNKNYNLLAYEGWAYCSRTPDQHIFLLYFEQGCPQAEIRGARLDAVYNAQWFDPRKGSWQLLGDGILVSGKTGLIKLPPLPDGQDWGLKLVYKGPRDEKTKYKEYEKVVITPPFYQRPKYQVAGLLLLALLAGGLGGYLLRNARKQ
ncbi:protein of unknown function [Cnuella takakiae]|uniref:DUF4038 domain-containing protein n=1 Tax=Cnuella takakiae TaxID=1302690 RepID=A0A1M5CDC5_9BACT|nr:DUF5060 domain-containing protein [Cnuella takakiae]OLY91772.1 hypothetical protein BUE76_07575 [Cnuella takakiae]SHF52743.1 protein of unknown function [Cnuella takakiae]